MKATTTILLLAFFATAAAQETSKRFANSYVCQNGKAHFFSSTPLEDIEATSNSAMCVINTETRKVSAKIPITSFQFQKKLMQEHFNENYLESDKYPYATFEGTVAEELLNKPDGVHEVTISGTLDMHGVKKQRDIKARITIKNGQLVSGTTNFDVKLADHNIKIPTAVVAKIAEVIKVDAVFTFTKYQKK